MSKRLISSIQLLEEMYETDGYTLPLPVSIVSLEAPL